MAKQRKRKSACVKCSIVAELHDVVLPNPDTKCPEDENPEEWSDTLLFDLCRNCASDLANFVLTWTTYPRQDGEMSAAEDAIHNFGVADDRIAFEWEP